jgi:two-component system sensor histidine kinase PilS (NtrC family)
MDAGAPFTEGVAGISMSHAPRVDVWRPLLYFSLYRCALAIVLVLLVLWNVMPRDNWISHQDLFRGVVLTYLVYAVVALVAVLQRWVRMERLAAIQIILDVLAITVLMHAGGGLPSGFALLLVVTVAGGSMLTEGRVAYLFAAIASLAVFTQQIWTLFHEPEVAPAYTHAGLLGIAFFATSLVISASARRLRASEALAARREVDLANLAQLNDHIIQRMQSGVLAADEGQRLRLMNGSAQLLLGVSHWQAGDVLSQLCPELAISHGLWREDPEHSSYLVAPQASGLRLVASFAGIGEGGRDGTVVFIEDAAATNQRAQQLKLASLGRLAGSIAHEIRNPLGAISHAGQLLDESEVLEDADRRLTRIIQENSGRMNAMVENILELGRGRNASPESLELRTWMEAFLEEFANRRPGAASIIHSHIDPPDLRVRVDPSQLHQILWNLCDNALQHAGEPPRVTVRAGVRERTGRPYLDVADNGSGISAEDLDRVFEPFFTTRDQGTGLGLYIARELCEGNQATLTLEDSEGGCRFCITFQDPRRRGTVGS